MKTRIPLLMIAVAWVTLMVGQVWAGPLPTSDFAKFWKERVHISGFAENITGLAIGPGDGKNTNVSNRFYMNRTTLQPEINVNIIPFRVRLFTSWRFVLEPRYNSEAKSRRATVNPPGTGGSLPVTKWSEFKGAPWEAVLDISPSDKLQIRLGRQFISWGETDGLRILDVINPQDGTIFSPAAPNVFSLDELRVPQYGIRAWYTVQPASNTVLEFFANPGFDPKKRRVDEAMPSNDISDGTASGAWKYGRWSAHPEDRLPFGRLFANPLCDPSVSPCTAASQIVIPSARKRFPNAGNNWKIGARITHNIGALNFGLGYIWGFNPQGLDQVFKLKGVSCLAPVPPGVPCPAPTRARIELRNDRTSIFAGHFNYPLGTYFGIPVKTATRGEVAFYPSKPYNVSKYPGPTGLLAGPSPNHKSQVVQRNNLRYSLGFDRTTFIHFLHPDDPWRAFRMSFQIFQSIILGHKDGIRNFFTAGKIAKVQTALTFRVSTGYLGDTILPDLFLLYEPLGSWVINPAVSYVPPWNERIKLSLAAAIYNGNKYRGFTGFFSGKDTVFLRLRYQFGGTR